ncbi:MAG TPA: hypothetical protein ENJ42_05320, partial [Hellea balneolensis]|nr:hypothetical protein [Hellea balneolensis]
MGNLEAEDGEHKEIVGREVDDFRIMPGMESEFFQILDNALDVGISILDENLNYVYINRFAADTLKLSGDEFQVGDPLSKVHKLMVDKGVIDPKVFDRHKLSAQELKSLFASGIDASRDLTPFKDGSVHRLVRKHTKNGYTISINHDVTRLLQKEEMLQKALELGNSGYWIYDFKSKKLELSKSMNSILSRDEINAMYEFGLAAFIHKDDRTAFKKALKDMHKNAGTIEFVARNLSGTKWYRTTGNS